MTEPAPHVSPVTGEPVTFEEAIGVATALQKNGNLEQAAEIYEKLLAVEPDHPDLLHFAGILAHQQGDSDRAVSLIERSLAHAPDRADCYSNLGIIFRAQGELDRAVDAYQRAIALKPEHAPAHNNLGVLWRAQEKPDEAEAAYRTAIRLDASLIDAHNNLGILLHSQGRMKEAVACFGRVTTLEPTHSEARRLRALAHCTLGEVDRAVEIFEDWLRDEPDNPVAQHLLAACSGREVPARASDAFVEKVFDDFAESFDAKLERLSYRAPHLVSETLAKAGLAPTAECDLLDAGCGTGLCGPLLAPYARTLVGVDLSERMLAQARNRGIYDELVKAELTGYLRASEDTFDVIVSADTLVYFGELDEVLAAAAGALRRGGVLVFTVEDAEAERSRRDGSDGGHRIQMHGRYTHARRYVTQTLESVGLQPRVEKAILRTESGSPVHGLVVSASKPQGVSHG